MTQPALRSVSDLRGHFNALIAARERVIAAVVADALPVWFPGECDTSRLAAGRALTPLWFDDAPHTVPYGCVCVSEDAAEAIEVFNAAKSEFAAHIDWFRETHDAAFASRSRHPKLMEHLRDVGLGRLNLTWCFRKVHVLGPGVRQISWVHCKHIKAIAKRKQQQLYDEAASLAESQRVMAQNLIGQQPPGTEFAVITRVGAHWRANIVYHDDSTYALEYGKLKRMVHAGVPLVCVSDTLPRTRQPRAPNDTRKRKPRSDRRHAQPLVASMNVFCYGTEGRHGYDAH